MTRQGAKRLGLLVYGLAMQCPTQGPPEIFPNQRSTGTGIYQSLRYNFLSKWYPDANPGVRRPYSFSATVSCVLFRQSLAKCPASPHSKQLGLPSLLNAGLLNFLLRGGASRCRGWDLLWTSSCRDFSIRPTCFWSPLMLPESSFRMAQHSSSFFAGPASRGRAATSIGSSFRYVHSAMDTALATLFALAIARVRLAGLAKWTWVRTSRSRRPLIKPFTRRSITRATCSSFGVYAFCTAVIYFRPYSRLSWYGCGRRFSMLVLWCSASSSARKTVAMCARTPSQVTPPGFCSTKSAILVLRNPFDR